MVGVRLLGTVSATRDSEPVQLPDRKARLVLAVLAVDAGQAVRRGDLVAAVWGDDPPVSAESSLYSYISRLRRALGADILTSEQHAYRLAIGVEDTDLGLARSLLEEVRRTTPGRAQQLTADALRLWRGTALADLLDTPWAGAESERIEDLRLSLVERWAQASLDLGEAARVADDLRGPCAANPERERMWALRMLALYRSGRQIEALQVYRVLRTTLVEQFGVEPAAETRALEAAMLRQDEQVLLGSSSAEGDQSLVLETTAVVPLIGRDREISALLRAQQEAEQSSGRVVLVGGEAGIGKTRLVHELSTRTSARVLWGRCWERPGAPSFLPWREVIDAWTRTNTRSDLRRLAGDLVEPIATVAPALAIQLSYTVSHILPDDAALARYEQLHAITTLLTRASAVEPLVIILEDVHGADGHTLDLLSYICPRLAETHLLLVVTYRPEDVGSSPVAATLSELALTGGAERLILPPLANDSTRELTLLHSTRLVDEENIAALVTRSGGNPLFAIELARLYEESGTVSAVPDVIGAAIEQRVARMPDEHIDVLCTAAVVGRSFSVDTLATIFDRERVMDAVRQANAAQLVAFEAGSTGTATFSHILVRESVLRRLDAFEQARRHRMVADAISQYHGGDEVAPAAELAEHLVASLSAGGDVDRALAATVRAAQEAVSFMGHTDAVDRYRVALRLEAQLPATQRTPRNRIELLLAFGYAAAIASLIDDYVWAHEEAAALARASGDGLSLARSLFGRLPHWQPWWRAAGVVDDFRVSTLRAALEAVGQDDLALRAKIQSALAFELYATGDLDEHVESSRAAVALARSTGDLEALGKTLSTHHSLLWTPRRLDERVAIAEELLKVASAVGSRVLMHHAHSHLVVDRLEQGDRAAVDEHVGALTVASKRPMHGERAVVSWLWAMVALLDGRLDAAEISANESFGFGTDGGDPDALGHFGIQLGLIRWEQDRLAEVVDDLLAMADAYPMFPSWRAAAAYSLWEVGRLDEARVWYQTVDFEHVVSMEPDFTWPLTMAFVAQCCWAFDDTDAAELVLDVLKPYSGRIVVAGAAVACWGAVDFFLGLLSTTLGRLDEACAWFETANDLHRRLGAVAWITNTNLRHAQALESRGRPSDIDRAGGLRSQALATAHHLGLARLTRLLSSP